MHRYLFSCLLIKCMCSYSQLPKFYMATFLLYVLTVVTASTVDFRLEDKRM